MPYITQANRMEYNEEAKDLSLVLDKQGYVPGHVTYVLFIILARWFKKDPCYDTIASIRGCLMGLVSELDRRYFFPYEDTKIEENGDVDCGYFSVGGTPKCTGPDCGCEHDIDTRGGA